MLFKYEWRLKLYEYTFGDKNMINKCPNIINLNTVKAMNTHAHMYVCMCVYVCTYVYMYSTGI